MGESGLSEVTADGSRLLKVVNGGGGRSKVKWPIESDSGRKKLIVDDQIVSMNLVKVILNYLCDNVFEKIEVRNFFF